MEAARKPHSSCQRKRDQIEQQPCIPSKRLVCIWSGPACQFVCSSSSEFKMVIFSWLCCAGKGQESCKSVGNWTSLTPSKMELAFSFSTKEFVESSFLLWQKIQSFTFKRSENLRNSLFSYFLKKETRNKGKNIIFKTKFWQASCWYAFSIACGCV